jgi:hypothetical protein
MNASNLPSVWNSAQHWRDAQAELAPSLASAASVFGALDERLRRRPAGDRLRLALQEAIALSRQLGDRVPEDRLVLLATEGEPDAALSGSAMQRAVWITTRLACRPFPEEADGLSVFLGREDPVTSHWLDTLQGAARMHPIVKSAWAYAMWRDAARAFDPPDTRLVEAAVLAARLGAGAVPGATCGAPYPRRWPNGSRRWKKDRLSHLRCWTG